MGRVRSHYRKSYYRKDGTYVRGTTVRGYNRSGSSETHGSYGSYSCYYGSAFKQPAKDPDVVRRGGKTLHRRMVDGEYVWEYCENGEWVVAWYGYEPPSTADMEGLTPVELLELVGLVEPAGSRAANGKSPATTPHVEARQHAKAGEGSSSAKDSAAPKQVDAQKRDEAHEEHEGVKDSAAPTRIQTERDANALNCTVPIVKVPGDEERRAYRRRSNVRQTDLQKACGEMIGHIEREPGAATQEAMPTRHHSPARVAYEPTSKPEYKPKFWHIVAAFLLFSVLTKYMEPGGSAYSLIQADRGTKATTASVSKVGYDKAKIEYDRLVSSYGENSYQEAYSNALDDLRRLDAELSKGISTTFISHDDIKEAQTALERARSIFIEEGERLRTQREARIEQERLAAEQEAARIEQERLAAIEASYVEPDAFQMTFDDALSQAEMDIAITRQFTEDTKAYGHKANYWNDYFNSHLALLDTEHEYFLKHVSKDEVYAAAGRMAEVRRKMVIDFEVSNG